MTSRLKIVAFSTLLCILTLWAYRNCYRVPLIFDDLRALVESDRTHSLWPLQDVWRGTRRPALYVTLAVNYHFGQLQPAGYHLFNVTVHLAAGLVLFALVGRTLQLPHMPERYRRASLYLSFCAAMLWTIHPLQTESVTYIVQRCESMMVLFYRLTLYCVLRGSQASSRAAGWYTGAAICFLLGLASKEVMATGFLVVPLYDRIFLSSSWKEMLKRRWGLYLAPIPAMVVLASTLAPTFRRYPLNAMGFGVMSVTPWEYLRTQPEVILHYLRLSVWPDQLCLDYMWPVQDSWSKIALCGGLVTGMLTACLAGMKYFPRIAFLGLSFFVVLSPTSSFIPIIDLAYEHRMYLPLAAVSILIVLGIYELSLRLFSSERQRRFALTVMMLLATLILGVRTSQRNKVYGDEVALWSSVIAAAPHNWSAYNNMAIQLARRGELAKAAAAYERSLALNPAQARVHDNYGNLFARQGDYQTASLHYRNALEQNEKYAPAYVHLGICQYELGDHAAAVENLRAGLELSERVFDGSRWLAWILATSPDPALRNGEEAVQLALQYMSTVGEQNVIAVDILAAAHAENGEFDKAVYEAARAAAMAREIGNLELAANIADRLEYYERREAFTDSRTVENKEFP